MNKIHKFIFWSPTLLMILFFSFIALMSLSEWWNIRIKNEIDNYAWGKTNENPWFYETPNLYANVMLIEGTLMLFFVFMTVKKIQAKEKFTYWFLGCFGFLLLILISSSIK